MKEFTVGDMIKVLQKLDSELPLYDHYYDDEIAREVWFNVARPRPKKKTIYLVGTRENDQVTLAWTDNRSEGQLIDKKKIVMLYPPESGVIEF
ncbi:MAG: hypothetical protein GQF41_3417 [Candidatus Rifleibacterium amylolyticum]|nr:MAG: hypothetical protein GQF41_3417 [Candidatus Rifleibacterium amylolyticum]